VTNFVFDEAGGQEPDTAVDVVTHRARGDHPVVQAHGRDPADGKSITPVDVRHGNRPAHDAWESSRVGDLLDRLVLLDLRQ